MRQILFTSISVLLLVVLVLTGCTEITITNYDEVSIPDTIIHSYWSEYDQNIGQKVWVGLVNKRNEYINEPIKGLTISLFIRGYDSLSGDYTTRIFEKTYYNVNLKDSDYPFGDGFIILFSELNNIEQDTIAAIWAEVVLPDGRVVKTHDAHHFETKPLVMP